MMSDPGFIFYPGDYLRDTQCLSERTQVAYDRIMCEHMRNICITHAQLKFFTKRLSEDEIEELKMVLSEIEGGYQITWVAESINKRRAYSRSRSKNRKKTEDKISTSYEKDMKTYVQHMDNEIEIDNEIDNESILEKSEKPFLEGNTELMGFIGKARIWIESEKHYIWDKQDQFAISSIEKKIKEVHRRGSMDQDKDSFFETFKAMINNLPEWIKNNKFSLTYIDQKFNEIIHAIHNEPNSKKPGAAPLSRQDEARLRAILESGALLGVD